MDRLPRPGTRWVWEINDDRNRFIIEVVQVVFTGEEWIVVVRTLPDGPMPYFGPLTQPRETEQELDRFWEAVTPIGGRLEELSNAIDPHQR